MADYSDSCREIKCRSLQRRRQPPLLVWCFLIACLLSLPSVFSKCLGVDITVAIYPPGEIIIEYGKPLELLCIGENYSSSDIQILLGGNHIKSEVVNSTTRRLYIEKPEKQSRTYYCHNKKNGKKCVSHILVESPPTDVTDFNCISYNLEILNCSWTSIHSLSQHNYSVTFSSNNYLATPPCYSEIFSTSSKVYCTWNTTSKPRYRQQEEKQYFYLTSCNIIGCNDQNFTIDHYSIVKPNPPYNLQVIENRPHSVDLMWRIPDNMVDLLHCGLDHIIEYQIAKIDNTTQFHRVNSSFLPAKNKTYRFQLANLPYAHKQYIVRVFIKSKKAIEREFWSDYSYVVFYTTNEEPKPIDNATVFITTSEDTPTNPVNISISDIKNTSLVISWDPPIHKNGNIGKYVIYNYDKGIYVDNVSGTDISHREVTITGLQSFSNYSLTVQACNIALGLCSKLRSSDSVTVTTKIGTPSTLRAPTLKTNPNKLYWKPPQSPGGRVDLYEIQRIKDDSVPEIISTTELSYALDYCVGVVSSETYQVRAVNLYGTEFKNGHYESAAYIGPWSEPSTVVCICKTSILV